MPKSNSISEGETQDRDKAARETAALSETEMEAVVGGNDGFAHSADGGDDDPAELSLA